MKPMQQGSSLSAPSVVEATPSSLNTYHRVFACDLNTPWDVHCVTSRSDEVTLLKWDEQGNTFVLADAEGRVEIWQMQEIGVISRWKCVNKQYFPKETFIKAKFVFKGRKVRWSFLSLDRNFN